MNRRSLSRHFAEHYGLSVGNWLINERLAFTQQLLEGSDLSIEQISEQAGFGSIVSLRHHFKRRFGVSPQHWRQTFRGEAS